MHGMRTYLRQHHLALIALFVALGGTSYAASQINGADLKNRSVAGGKLKNDTLGGRQIRESRLGRVPSAGNADSLGGAPSSAFVRSRAESWHLVGQTVGEPQFGSNWMNNGIDAPIRFYKDQIGIVHLGGSASSNPGSSRIFTLPPGYRPQYPLVLAPNTNSCGTGAVFVAKTGEVSAGTAGSVCNLDAMSFRAG